MFKNKSFIGFGGPHHSEEDIHVGHYKIPVGTDIFPDLLGFLRSEQYWEEPDTFDPTRFLGGNSMPFCNKNNFRSFLLGSFWVLFAGRKDTRAISAIFGHFLAHT